jgi:hypothetical protein
MRQGTKEARFYPESGCSERAAWCGKRVSGEQNRLADVDVIGWGGRQAGNE